LFVSIRVAHISLVSNISTLDAIANFEFKCVQKQLVLGFTVIFFLIFINNNLH